MLTTVRKICGIRTINSRILSKGCLPTLLPLGCLSQRFIYNFSSNQDPKDSNQPNKTGEAKVKKEKNKKKRFPGFQYEEDFSKYGYPSLKTLAVLMTLGVILGFGASEVFKIGQGQEKIVQKYVMEDAQKGQTPRMYFGGQWDLIDTNGNPFGSEQLQLLGSHYLIYFGFTKCPDVCPTTLFYINQTLKSIRVLPGGQDVDVKVIFVSVDPERDTPQVLQKYLGHFGENFIGVTAPSLDDKRMQSIMKKFKVYARRVENPQNPDSYNVDHTSLVFLMNERSEFVDILNPGLPQHESAAAILNKIKNKTQWKM